MKDLTPLPHFEGLQLIKMYNKRMEIERVPQTAFSACNIFRSANQFTA